jgi:pyrroloquinoline-quinone synthase
VTRARTDSLEAIEYVTKHAVTRAAQERCVAALVTKCEILWALVDAVSLAYPDEPAGGSP